MGYDRHDWLIQKKEKIFAKFCRKQKVMRYTRNVFVEHL